MIEMAFTTTYVLLSECVFKYATKAATSREKIEIRQSGQGQLRESQRVATKKKIR
jgi:hypothetical protein